MHTNTFCKYRKNYSHRLACILFFIQAAFQAKLTTSKNNNFLRDILLGFFFALPRELHEEGSVFLPQLINDYF